MSSPTIPDALLLLTGSCPHCPQVLQALSELVKLGLLGRLEVVNLEVHPEVAQALGVRSVPWLRIGPFEFSGLRSREELESWARRAADGEGMADYFHVLLKEGGLSRTLAMVEARPELLAELLPVVANPEASMNVRLGASAVFERYAGGEALHVLVPRLAALSTHEDARVRADACHFLGLARTAAARPALEARLADADADVREIAAEGLEDLSQAGKT